MGSPGRLQLGRSCLDPVPGQLMERCQPPLPASLPCLWLPGEQTQVGRKTLHPPRLWKERASPGSRTPPR